MACRRSITTRAKLLYQQRSGPCFAYISQDEDRRRHQSVHDAPRIPYFLQSQSFGSTVNSSSGLNGFCRERKCSQLFLPISASIAMGGLFARHMSTTVGEGADKLDYMTDVAEVIADKTIDAVASQVPAVNEVAIAAADSFLPVAALQHVIDAVHSFTGFNWWGSIIVTSLLIRATTIPFLINQLKATSKLTIMRPRLEEIKEEMQQRGMSPTAVAEGQQRMQALFKEYGVTPWTPLKGLLIQGPVFVSFFLAIQNMVEKVPSFKSGGAFWFVDLTTPDSLYIFPVLTALTFWITVECNAQEGLEGNPVAGTMKTISRVFAGLTVPLTMSFPKAIFCYWITSNLFSLVYGLVIKRPAVKNFLGVPIIPAAPATASPKAPFSFSEAMKKYIEATQKTSPSNAEPAKPPIQRISSSSVINQRIKSLEKEVKGRKKGKK